MIIFNITCHIEKAIDNDFITWVSQVLAPQISNSDFVNEVVFLRLITEIDENAMAYTFQIHFKNMVYYNQFQIEEEFKVISKIQNQFSGKIFTFTSLLEKV